VKKAQLIYTMYNRDKINIFTQFVHNKEFETGKWRGTYMNTAESSPNP